MATPQQKCKIINFEPTAVLKFLLDLNSNLHIIKINRTDLAKFQNVNFPWILTRVCFFTSHADQKPSVNNFYVYQGKEIGYSHLVFVKNDLDETNFI